MKSCSHAPRLFGVLLLAPTLIACAQSRVQESPAEAATAERIALLTDQVASLQRYSAQMEEIYAAQEAEILSLEQEIARRGPSQ